MSADSHHEGDLLHVVTSDEISSGRRRLGRTLVWASFAVFAATFLAVAMQDSGRIALPFTTWRPALYAFLVFAVCLCAAQVILYGEKGKRSLFVLPAALFVVAMVVFPLIFAVSIAMSDWNLSSPDGQKFNGVENLRLMWHDPFYWNALRNMLWYVLAILVEYAIAFGLAMLLNADIRARKFWRVVFLMPLMLSPVAVSWMVGKSMLEIRFGHVLLIFWFASMRVASLRVVMFECYSQTCKLADWHTFFRINAGKKAA